jgi:hypothetical protein
VRFAFAGRAFCGFTDADESLNFHTFGQNGCRFVLFLFERAAHLPRAICADKFMDGPTAVL